MAVREWIPASHIEPSELEGVVSGKFGSTVMFAAYTTLTGWQEVYPNGVALIYEPPLLLLDPNWARLHPRKSPVIRVEKPGIKRRKTDQLLLEI